MEARPEGDGDADGRYEQRRDALRRAVLMPRWPESCKPVEAMRRDVGIQLIVAYKLGKAALELVIGIVLLVLAARVTHGLAEIVRSIRDHATAAWSLVLAHALARLVT